MQQDKGLSQGSSVKDLFCSNIFGSVKSSVLVRFSVLALLIVACVGGATADQGGTSIENSQFESSKDFQSLMDEYDSATDSIAFSSNGNYLYVLSSGQTDNENAVYQFSLSSSYDISSVSQTGKLDVSSAGGNSYGLYLSPDDKKLFVGDISSSEVVRWDMSSANDISTASEVGSVSVDGGMSVDFKPDGTMMYTSDFANDEFEMWELSTAWDLSTASKVGTWSEDLGDENNDLRVYKGYAQFLERNSGVVREYKLGTDWDITTANFERDLDVSSRINGLFLRGLWLADSHFWLGDSDGGYIYQYEGTTNEAPKFNSSSVSPDPVLIGENVSYSAEVYDPDGSVDYTNLTLEYGGSTVVVDEQRTGTTPEWNDVFTPQMGDKWLNATLETVDDAGAVTTTEINRYLSDNPPTISLNDPQAQDYFTYDVPLEVEASDSDSNPDEVYSCSVGKNTSQSTVASFTLYENGTNTYSDVVRSDLGSHDLTVTCSDGAGNTDSVSQAYDVKSQSFVGQTHTSPVYESKTPQSNLEVKVGEMVNDLEASLVFNGTVQNSSSDSRSDVGNLFLTAENLGVPIVQNNDTSVDAYWSYDVNRTKIGGGTVVDSYTSPTKTQSIYHAIHTPQISTDSDRYIEKEDVQASLAYTDEGFNGDVSCTNTVNGTTKNGECSNGFDSGLASTNKESINVEGEASVSFDGDSRVIGPVSKSVDVYKKILTDGTNSVDGVTGVKALEFTLLNEENRSQELTGNIDYNFDVTHHGEHTRNYAFENTGVKSSSVYMYPSWAEYSVSGPVQYSSESSQNSNNLVYPDRQYNLFNQSLNSNSSVVDLYLLDESFTSPVYFEVTDQGGNPVPGATVKVQRYFIGSNSYLTVAKSEADSEGVATTYMRINEIYYKYTVTDKDGEVLLNTDRQILTCQSSPCTKELRVNPEADNPYFVDKEGFQFNTSEVRDDDGNLTGFQATVSHKSDVFKEANLVVDRKKSISSENICDITATSNPSTMVCSFDKPAGDDRISYSLTAKTNDYEFTLDKGVLNEPPNLFGDNAYFAGFIIFAMFSMIGLASPKSGIIFSTAGIIIPWYLGFYEISLAAVGSLAIVALALVVTNES